jgi:hypothetical protein
VDGGGICLRRAIFYLVEKRRTFVFVKAGLRFEKGATALKKQCGGVALQTKREEASDEDANKNTRRSLEDGLGVGVCGVVGMRRRGSTLCIGQ